MANSMREAFKKHKQEEEAKRIQQEVMEEYVMQQTSFMIAEKIEEKTEEHRQEMSKEDPYKDYEFESSIGDILSQVGFGGVTLDNVNEIKALLENPDADITGDMDVEMTIDEEAPYVPESMLPVVNDPMNEDAAGDYDNVNIDVEEEIPFDSTGEDIDVDAIVEAQEAEDHAKEEKVKAEEAAEKQKTAGKNSEKIEANTKKLPKNEFVAPKVADTKKPKIIAACIALFFCVYFGLVASSYYYDFYVVPKAEAEYASASVGFGSKPSSKNTIAEPNALKCLTSGLMEGESPDLGKFQAKPFFSVTFMLIGVCGLVVIWNVTKKSSEKQMRVNEEYGNKHLMTKNDLKRYRAQFMETDNYNQIYARDMALSLNNKKTNRSANVLVIGGTGTGKTFKYINPNILQENATQIITDPSGDLFNKFAPFLLNKGYNVFLFNVNDFNISSYYNPLLNVFDAFGNISEVKVDVLVDLYMKNAKAGKEAGGGDPFWDKAEKAFLTAVIYYVLENDDIAKEDKCFHTVLEKVQRAKAENQNGKSAGETMLTKEINAWKAKVERQNKKIKTPIYYDTFLIAPEKTANTILITTAVDLQIFATEEVNRVTRFKGEYENTNMYINFDDMAQTQSYLFLGIPQSHQAYNFLISMLYSQMYARLYELGERVLQGKYCLGYRPEIPQFNCFDSKEEMFDFVDNIGKQDEKLAPNHPDHYVNIIEKDYINSTKIYYLAYKGKVYKRSVNRDVLVTLINDLPKMVYKCNNNYPELPIHVNFLLDEFKNIGEIPNFLTILSTSRKYRIGSHVILQDIAQAQTIYKDKEYETLLANVDTTIFLGSILQADKEEIQKMLGKTTIKIRNQSTGQGSTPNYNYNATQVDLVSISDLEKINQDGRDDCVVMVRDVPPFIGRKAYLTEHPKYNDFKNASKNLHFDLTRYYNNAIDILGQ